MLGKTDSLLYRRGNFDGTFDDLICQALMQERDAEIALSPGFRWGTSVLPGQDVTFEDVTNATAITYPAVYRMGMTGARLKEIIEDVADNLFNVDPYYQQGGDMVRIGGLAYAIDVARPQGQRISNMQLVKPAADRGGEGISGRGLGQRQRGNRRTAHLGCRRELPGATEDGSARTQ